MLLHKSVQYDSRVRREASTLAAFGHDLVVVELTEIPPDSASLDGFARRSAMPPERIRRVLPWRMYRVAMLLFFLREVLRLRPQVVHAHDAAMLIPGWLGARLVGARLVYDSHELATSVPYRERTWAWFVRSLESVIVPRCTAVITVSDGIAERLQELYKLSTRPSVIRNVSDLAGGGPGGLRAGLGVGADTPVVLHQGAPAPGRGCEVLVDAIALLDDVRLVFLGDPEPGFGEELSRRITLRDVKDRVRMLPSVPLDELLSWTAEADVGVTLLQDTCENHRLALPNKLFEYVAAGVPVVASDLPETRRLVNEYGIGWCVKPDDPQALADTLRLALSHRQDPELAGRLLTAGQELRWPVESQRLIALYERLG
jgi:glycosyltransferase involved in cell wall biosynthesis